MYIRVCHKVLKSGIRRPCLLDLWDEIDNMTPKKKQRGQIRLNGAPNTKMFFNLT